MQVDHTNYSASITEASLLAARNARLGATVYNDSASATLYLKLASGVTATSFMVPLGPGQAYELPLLPGDRVWDGVIYGIWTAAVGAARVTEVW